MNEDCWHIVTTITANDPHANPTMVWLGLGLWALGKLFPIGLYLWKVICEEMEGNPNTK